MFFNFSYFFEKHNIKRGGYFTYQLGFNEICLFSEKYFSMNLNNFYL